MPLTGLAEGGGARRLRGMPFLNVPGVYDYVGSQLGLAIAPSPVWPSPCIHKAGIPDSPFRSSIPCPPMPSAYASAAASRPPPQDSRSGGSLLLSCRTLSFPTACRFIPALGYPAMAPHCHGFGHGFLTRIPRIRATSSRLPRSTLATSNRSGPLNRFSRCFHLLP